MITPILHIFLAVLSACLFVGCSAKPRLPDGEQALRARIQKDSEGRLKMTKFQKTGDEMAYRFPGEKVDNFCWAFVGEVQATEDCVWLFDRVTGTLPIDFRTALAGTLADGAVVKQGQRYSVRGTFYLSKPAKDWTTGTITFRQIPREVP